MFQLENTANFFWYILKLNLLENNFNLKIDTN